MPAADLQPITLTDLGRLYADATARGWRHDRDTGSWHDEDRCSSFTIRPAAHDVRMLPVRAHTPTGDLRLSVDPHQLGTAIQILRLFLGWPESEDA